MVQQAHNNRITADATPNHLSISSSLSCHFWTRPQDTWTPFCLSQKLTPKRKGAVHSFSAENHGLRLEHADSNPRHFTLDHKPSWCILEVMYLPKKPQEQYHPQKAETQFWGSTTWHTPHPGWSYQQISQTGLETWVTLEGAQHPLEISLTLLRVYGHCPHFGCGRIGWQSQRPIHLCTIHPQCPQQDFPDRVIGPLKVHKTHVDRMTKLPLPFK